MSTILLYLVLIVSITWLIQIIGDWVLAPAESRTMTIGQQAFLLMILVGEVYFAYMVWTGKIALRPRRFMLMH